jgi:TonB family protein
VPEPADEAAQPDPPEPEPEKAEPVAKATEPAEPGIQLVTPLMEAVALKYPYYMNALKRKINENWSPPGAGFAEAREVLVVFTILRDGSVRGAEVEQSSGDVFYDQAALRSVLRATPFPPLPDGYPSADMKIHFSFLLDPDRMS